MNYELQTCPDRNKVWGPWERGENLDRWNTGRWSRNILAMRIGRFFTILSNRIKNHGEQTLFMDKHSYEWLWKGAPPRTCSFCGGIHPEDAIRLIQDGWEVETTGKTYKRYLEPPGYKARMERLHELLQDAIITGRGPADLSVLGEFWSPVPPVKLYVSHFTPDQVARFNKLLPPKPTYPGIDQ